MLVYIITLDYVVLRDTESFAERTVEPEWSEFVDYFQSYIETFSMIDCDLTEVYALCDKLVPSSDSKLQTVINLSRADPEFKQFYHDALHILSEYDTIYKAYIDCFIYDNNVRIAAEIENDMNTGALCDHFLNSGRRIQLISSKRAAPGVSTNLDIDTIVSKEDARVMHSIHVHVLVATAIAMLIMFIMGIFGFDGQFRILAMCIIASGIHLLVLDDTRLVHADDKIEIVRQGWKYRIVLRKQCLVNYHSDFYMIYPKDLIDARQSDLIDREDDYEASKGLLRKKAPNDFVTTFVQFMQSRYGG